MNASVVISVAVIGVVALAGLVAYRMTAKREPRNPGWQRGLSEPGQRAAGWRDFIPSAELRQRREEALNRAHELSSRYKRIAKGAQISYRTFQSAVIVLSGLTPILTAIFGSSGLLAAPAGLAALIAGINQFWNFQATWTRCLSAAQELESEIVKFETRSVGYRGQITDEAINTFVTRIENIAGTVLADWRSQMAIPAGGTQQLTQRQPADGK